MTIIETRPTLPRWARILLTVAALVIVVAGLRAASSILVPFFIAAFLSVIASPLVFWLERKGVPAGLAVLIVVLGILGIGVGMGTLVGTSLNDFTQALPEYQTRLEEERDEWLAWMAAKGLNVPKEQLIALVDPRAAMRLTATVLRGLGGVLTNAFLIILTTVFILLEASTFSAKMPSSTGETRAGNGGFKQFSGSVQRYIAIKTIVSLATGTLVTIWLLILGVDFAFLWGLLAFLLNYVPNIGSIIAAVPAFLVALIQFGPGRAGLVALGYVILNLVFGSIIEPRFMGRGLGLSPLIVFLSLIFWGWVFGPVGMLLSVLLTVTLKMALESGNETRWIAVLMGSEAPSLEPAPAVAAPGDPSPPGSSPPAALSDTRSSGRRPSPR
jgi:predicted PurR-regulated permease PerM